jgi:hypothetical protein
MKEYERRSLQFLANIYGLTSAALKIQYKNQALTCVFL